MSRRHARRVTMRHHTITLRNGSTLRWTEYPYGNRSLDKYRAHWTFEEAQIHLGVLALHGGELP